MNGSGSAPITIDPGWPHGVQQTTLPGGVFRYTPWVPYEDCCRYFCRASAGEATTIPIPTTEAINPTKSVVLSILAGMGVLHRFPTHAPANMTSVADTSQPTFITSACRRRQLIFAASRRDSSPLLGLARYEPNALARLRIAHLCRAIRRHICAACGLRRLSRIRK